MKSNPMAGTRKFAANTVKAPPRKAANPRILLTLLRKHNNSERHTNLAKRQTFPRNTDATCSAFHFVIPRRDPGLDPGERARSPAAK
jgi:hypothetical protein